MSIPMCCLEAVYDRDAGWWCPKHGDQMAIEFEAAGDRERADVPDYDDADYLS